MPTEFSPKDLQRQVGFGFDRFHNFRAARLMFLRNYVGQYYDRSSGAVGDEPLAMIFNAIRSLIPHIVMSFPKHKVNSKWLQHKDYADLLGLALESSDKEIDIKTIYRRVAVDALFTLGIMKTGLAQSDSIYSINEYDMVDNGSVYTGAVDFDNFVADPRSREHMFVDAQWMGDRICVPRQALLDSGLYKNDLVEKLPRVGGQSDETRAQEISQRGLKGDDLYESEDYVEVVELWVPGANALVTVPGDKDFSTDDFLRVSDYYGPKEGPYTLLALTPPVPGSPLPVPSVGIWNDLHVLANRMARKVVQQAERQKDIVTYQRKAIDDVVELQNAGDGEAVAVEDVEAVRTLSFGGQQSSNENHLSSLAAWFNMMSANPDRLSGGSSDARSATAESNLQSNASIGISDVKDLIYTAAGVEARKRAWFLHVDPLIQKPLTRRRQVPAQTMQGPMGPVVLQPAQMVEEQVILTPEIRRGDFMDFAFEIVTESMGRPDPQRQFAVAIDFCTKILPAVMTAAQTAAMMGIPFSAKAMLIRLAKEANIDWLEEVYYDPEFQMQMQMQLMAGPQMQNSVGQAGGQASPAALLQNGQPANVGFNAPPAMQQRQEQQSGAVPAQQMLKQGY